MSCVGTLNNKAERLISQGWQPGLLEVVVVL